LAGVLSAFGYDSPTPDFSPSLSARRSVPDIFGNPKHSVVSVVETCRRLKIPIRDYLCSILPGLANFPINRIAELMPAAWLARN
jgi:hypothetical protein